VRIQVKDTGIGIPQDSLELIFQEFRQVSEGFNRHFEGTGLGLTITKEFVEMLNGRIGVVSRVGSGSTFTIILPLLKDYKPSDHPGTISDESGTQQDEEEKLVSKPYVLIVENDEASRDITRLFLQKNCELEFAESGEEAIELIKTMTFDIILMDINLGKGISGVEATKEIRKSEQYKDTPIVALTSFAMRGDREEFIKAGCTHYLSKPFTRGSIIKLINNIVNQKS
jgi:CheY-like chemotaxis protein